MIELLLELGLSEQDIKVIKDFICEDNKHDLEKNIKLLKNIGCDNFSIKNIIIGNPFFLQRNNTDIYKLILYLQQLGFTYIKMMGWIL